MSTATRDMRIISSPPSTLQVGDDINLSTDLTEAGERLRTGSKENPLMDDMLKTPEQIPGIRRGSALAEERGENVESQFWSTYKKVSNEHDNDFLERANDDMGIILTFAGLFSAVNSTFIVGMQPNPSDTTNALMLQLINVIANGSDAVDINSLSSSTTYSSSTVWTQTLSYGSLALSVLAAFGAVLGKQWLNSYKAAPGRGSLEERSMQRQKKLDGLEYWRLQTILGVFLIILQISLLLFGLSLSAIMWPQQKSISTVLICTTAFGILFYGATVIVSVLRPDSPFRTPGSVLVETILAPFRSNSYHEMFIKSSAVRWVLETSTNPEVVAAAAPMIPRVQWPRNIDASAVYVRLLDNFALCLNRPELFVTYGKAMAHLRALSVKIGSHYWKESNTWRSWENKSQFIRDAFTDASLAWDRFRNTADEHAQRKYKADARASLRTMVVYGMGSRLSLPDDEELIWEGDLQWYHDDGRTPSCAEFDWLVDYLATKVGDETKGDALLALSAMHGLGSAAKRVSYVRELNRCMNSTSSSRVQHTALRAVSDAREELACIDDDPMPHDVHTILLEDLSRAILASLRHATGGSDAFHLSRDRCYLRLLFALTRSDEWCKRLAHHDHVERCISLLDEVLESSHDLNFYLAGIFARIDPSGRDPSFGPSEEKWQTLMTNAWYEAAKLSTKECVEVFPALVAATQMNLPGSDNELRNLTRYVNWVLQKLLRKQEDLDLAKFVLPSVQCLYDELHRMEEH